MNTNRSVKLSFSALALALLFAAFPSQAHGWGSKGHQIIARIANQRLSTRARKGIADLLKGQSLEAASTWADLQRSSQVFHFVAIPVEAKGYERERDCPKDRAGNYNCLIERIKYYREILQDPKQSSASRAEALKYVLHLIGDLHQPFHCTEKHGNTVRVTFNNSSTNLHRLWDDAMITKVNLPVESYARTIEDDSKVTQASYNIARGTIVDWALESNSMAREASKVGDGDLSKQYYQDNKEILNRQLYRAGVRLAAILNDIFR